MRERGMSKTPFAVLLVITVSCCVGVVGRAQESFRPSIEEKLPPTYEQLAMTFSAEIVPDAIDVLISEDAENLWVNAAAILGIVGDQRSVDALIDFIERAPPDALYVTAEHNNARTEALKSLGVAVARTGNLTALNYLIDSLDDNVWRKRVVLGVYSAWPTYEEYDRRLSIYAIVGLALSGHPRAGEALRALDRSPSSSQWKLRRELDDVLETWLGVYDRVSDEGLLRATSEHSEH